MFNWRVVQTFKEQSKSYITLFRNRIRNMLQLIVIIFLTLITNPKTIQKINYRQFSYEFRPDISLRRKLEN